MAAPISPDRPLQPPLLETPDSSLEASSSSSPVGEVLDSSLEASSSSHPLEETIDEIKETVLGTGEVGDFEEEKADYKFTYCDIKVMEVHPRNRTKRGIKFITPKGEIVDYIFKNNFKNMRGYHGDEQSFYKQAAKEFVKSGLDCSKFDFHFKKYFIEAERIGFEKGEAIGEELASNTFGPNLKATLFEKKDGQLVIQFQNRSDGSTSKYLITEPKFIKKNNRAFIFAKLSYAFMQNKAPTLFHKHKGVTYKAKKQ